MCARHVKKGSIRATVCNGVVACGVQVSAKELPTRSASAPRNTQPRPFALQSACLFDGGTQRVDYGAAECALFQNLKAADGRSGR